HACANPLTARYGTTHGIAIALMLPHVVRWNAEAAGDRYAALLRVAGREAGSRPAERLAERLEELARAGGLPRTLQEIDVASAAACASRPAGVAPGIDATRLVVMSAADVPIMRPPTFAAKLSPVPRRYVGYTRGR